jgi:antitoxin VapB
MYTPVGYTWGLSANDPLYRVPDEPQPGRPFAKSVDFPDGVHRVEIVKLGQSRLINPVGLRWDDLFLDGPRASDDFMTEHRQPEADVRQPL